MKSTILATTTAVILPVFVLTYLYLKARPPSTMPPGPQGWPFIGHLDQIYNASTTKEPLHKLTDRWGKQYGGLFSKFLITLFCSMHCIWLTVSQLIAFMSYK